MKSLPKKTVILLIIFAIVLGYFLFFCPRKKVSIVDDCKKGKPDASVQIVEYMDYECPACAAGGKYLKEIMDHYSDKIRLEMHFFPLESHRQSLLAARYAECAARQKNFWRFHERLINEQMSWKMLLAAGVAFDAMAKDIGLNNKELRTCLDQPDVIEKILADKNQGSIRGVKATPTYFVNNKMIVGPDKLKEELEALLEPKQK